MEYLVTAEEMRSCEAYIIQQVGVPSSVVMERAALSLLWALCGRVTKEKMQAGGVLIAVGEGNNGADGLALARLLWEEGIRADLLFIGDEERCTEDWHRQMQILRQYPVFFHKSLPPRPFAVVVDALFGIGLSRPVTGKWAELIEDLDYLDSFKLAVDIPSGICATTGKVMGKALACDATVSFGFYKRGMILYPGRAYVGERIRADIGLSKKSLTRYSPSAYFLNEGEEDLLPQRLPYGNKSTFGKILIMAGSENMAGAALLAAGGAYRAGAGMVKVLGPIQNAQAVWSVLPECLWSQGEDMEADLDWAHVLVAGPGMGMGDEAKSRLALWIRGSQKPLVLDGDALHILALDKGLMEDLARSCAQGRQVALTPHPLELCRLADCDMEMYAHRGIELAGELARRLGAVIAAKDAATVVVGPDRHIFINAYGNDGMAVAGSGDVLAGMLGGLMGQRLDAYGAATHGVALHGLLGDKAAKAKGRHGMRAMDLILG